MSELIKLTRAQLELAMTGSEFYRAKDVAAEIAKLKDERDKWAHRAERLYSKLDEEHYTDQDTDRWFNSDGQAIIEAAKP